MTARRTRRDSHPLLRVLALAGGLVVLGLIMDGFGRVLEAACRAVFR